MQAKSRDDGRNTNLHKQQQPWISLTIVSIVEGFEELALLEVLAGISIVDVFPSFSSPRMILSVGFYGLEITLLPLYHHTSITFTITIDNIKYQLSQNTIRYQSRLILIRPFHPPFQISQLLEGGHQPESTTPPPTHRNARLPIQRSPILPSLSSLLPLCIKSESNGSLVHLGHQHRYCGGSLLLGLQSEGD